MRLEIFGQPVSRLRRLFCLCLSSDWVWPTWPPPPRRAFQLLGLRAVCRSEGQPKWSQWWWSGNRTQGSAGVTETSSWNRLTKTFRWSCRMWSSLVFVSRIWRSTKGEKIRSYWRTDIQLRIFQFIVPMTLRWTRSRADDNICVRTKRNTWWPILTELQTVYASSGRNEGSVRC